MLDVLWWLVKCWMFWVGFQHLPQFATPPLSLRFFFLQNLPALLLCFSLWAKDGSCCLGCFLCRRFVIFWLVEGCLDDWQQGILYYIYIYKLEGGFILSATELWHLSVIWKRRLVWSNTVFRLMRAFWGRSCRSLPCPCSCHRMSGDCSCLWSCCVRISGQQLHVQSTGLPGISLQKTCWSPAWQSFHCTTWFTFFFRRAWRRRWWLESVRWPRSPTPNPWRRSSNGWRTSRVCKS